MFCCLLFCSVLISQISPGFSKCRNISGTVQECINGECIDDSCGCNQGWTGTACDECQGRTILTEDSGFVTDGPNDYAKGGECSWLIQPESGRNVNVTIRLRLLEFATECGWDYLYIYDGDSAASPLLATFNGLIWDQNQEVEDYRPEVVAQSGSVFLHFFSDVEYVMKGFNISYAIHSCPQQCSMHGECTTSGAKCSCDIGRYGNGCEFESCPSNCSNALGQGYCPNATALQNNTNVCICNRDYQGLDCSYTNPSQQGFWTGVQASTATFNAARSSHSGVIVDDEMWLFGGIQFETLSQKGSLDVYNFTSDEWRRVDTPSTNAPSGRYGHSMVQYENKILVFGGRELTTSDTKDELWRYNMDVYSWNNINYTLNFSNPYNWTTSPLALWGHSGTIVELTSGRKIMLVMFGFNTEYEYSGFVFEYDVITQVWSKALTSGAKIEAAFEHTTTWDPINRLCYIHGGMTYLTSSYGMTDALYSYQPDEKVFQVLRSSGVPRYLHSAFLSNGVLFSYGGCTHNDSNKSTGALCFSPSFMAYHVACDTWEHLPPLDSRYDPNRYGHTALLFNAMENNATVMVVYGGYDGRMLDSVLMYQTSTCEAFENNQSRCAENHPGLSCVWNGTNCVSAMMLASHKTQNVSCRATADDSASYCDKLKSCASCVNSASECFWCGTICYKNECTSEQQASNASCDESIGLYCERFRTCGQCEINEECQWTDNTGCQKRTTNVSAQCPGTCSMRTTCDECVSPNCMWCANKELCVSTSSYVAQFPYGECMKWLNKKNQCPSSKGCGAHRTCDDCLSDPFCGWCDDGSQTGLGICQTGSSSGSQTSNSSENVISYTRIVEYNSTIPVCSAESWFFSSCPLCQCNGHSKCVNGTSECISCEDFTTGEQCQTCVEGYFGMATNGGSCQPCQCFDRATSCDDTTGACFCNTKGATGDKCDECDNDAKYYGDLTSNGTCYYRLLINYSFTFTLTKMHDRYITDINFENTPPLPNDAELAFESNEPCTVRLTVFSRRQVGGALLNGSEDLTEYEEQEVDVITFTNAQKFSYDFPTAAYGFGDRTTNATIRIYVSNVTIPTWIQVSLVQRNSFLLMLLLILFSVFLVLLLLVALIWKLKMLYDSCQRRRLHAEQLVQMAARPFASVHLSFDDIHSIKTLQQILPTGTIEGLSEEVCALGRAAAVSVALLLPTGNGLDPKSEEDTNSADDGGALAIGTTLVTRKPSARELDYSERNFQTKSRRKRMRIVFKRGQGSSRASTHQGTSTNQGGLERTPNAVPGSSRTTNQENSHGGIPNPSHSSRQRSKRGRSSFSSLRSRSVSPTSEQAENSRRRSRRGQDANALPSFASQGRCTDSRSEGIAV